MCDRPPVIFNLTSAVGDGTERPATPGLAAPMYFCLNSLKPGDLFGGFRIVKLIAVGGAGEVYEAEKAGQHFALKILQVRHASSDLEKRMRCEADILANIHHPNIVDFFGSGIDRESNRIWIALELLQGKTLRDLLMQRQGFSEPQALQYILSIALGINEAHKRGIIHRDLKPENIFVTLEHVVKILDFGIAKFFGNGIETDRRKTVGTPAYMSPEHIRNQTLDTRADIYALGLIAYEAISGTHPMAVNGCIPANFIELAARQVHFNPKPLKTLGFSERLSKMVEKAMMKDRHARFQDIEELITEIRRIIHNRPQYLCRKTLRSPQFNRALDTRSTLLPSVAVVSAKKEPSLASLTICLSAILAMCTLGVLGIWGYKPNDRKMVMSSPPTASVSILKEVVPPIQPVASASVQPAASTPIARPKKRRRDPVVKDILF